MGDTRILIIGEAPGPHDDGHPVEGRIGRRLADYAGLTFDDFLDRTERANLLTGPWSNQAARQAADIMILGGRLTGRRTIVLGQLVATAFGVSSSPLKWVHLVGGRGTSIAIVPHPSGLNRWWNDPGHQEAARRFLSDALGESA